MNDLLIVAVSRAAERWIDQHEGEAQKISVQMPVNARPTEWSTEVVANLVSGDTVSTLREERRSAAGCLSVVAGWTEAVEDRGPGPAMAALASIPHQGVGGRRAAIKAASWIGDALILTPRFRWSLWSKLAAQQFASLLREETDTVSTP